MSLFKLAMTKKTNVPATELSNNVMESSNPKEDHERPASSSSEGTGKVDLEKQHNSDRTSPAERVQSSTDSIYPGGKERAFVMIALMLAIFLVALVQPTSLRTANNH